MAVERLSSAQCSVGDGVSRDDEPDEREVGGVEHGDVSDSETGTLVMASFSVAVHRGLGVGVDRASLGSRRCGFGTFH
jgi:hypothetical protein